MAKQNTILTGFGPWTTSVQLLMQHIDSLESKRCSLDDSHFQRVQMSGSDHLATVTQHHTRFCCFSLNNARQESALVKAEKFTQKYS